MVQNSPRLLVLVVATFIQEPLLLSIVIGLLIFGVVYGVIVFGWTTALIFDFIQRVYKRAG